MAKGPALPISVPGPTAWYICADKLGLDILTKHCKRRECATCCSSFFWVSVDKSQETCWLVYTKRVFYIRFLFCDRSERNSPYLEYLVLRRVVQRTVPQSWPRYRNLLYTARSTPAHNQQSRSTVAVSNKLILNTRRAKTQAVNRLVFFWKLTYNKSTQNNIWPGTMHGQGLHFCFGSGRGSLNRRPRHRFCSLHFAAIFSTDTFVCHSFVFPKCIAWIKQSLVIKWEGWIYFPWLLLRQLALDASRGGASPQNIRETRAWRTLALTLALRTPCTTGL